VKTPVGVPEGLRARYRNLVARLRRYGASGKGRNELFPALTFRARIFAALVGISAVTSLVIGLVLYSFAEDRLVKAESNLLVQRSRTANAGASDFLEGLRDPEDGTIPAPDTYAEELVRSVADPTGLGVLYVGPEGRPLAARDGQGNSLDPQKTYESLGIEDRVVRSAQGDAGGKLVSGGELRYVTVWPLSAADGTSRGALIYTASQVGLDTTLAYLRYGILGAILTSVLLAALGSLLLTRQLTRPLTETRDAAIRIATGDYGATVPVTGRDELGEVARAFNYMAEEIEHYVGEIRDQKSRLEAVLEATPEAIVATDTGERITMANPAAALLLGILPSHSGRPLEEVGVPAQVVSCVREAATAGVAVREFEAGEKTLWAYAARMGNGTGDAANIGTIIAVRDTTDQRSLERAKTTFVSDVSHELRTPLTTIQSAVDLIARARERLDPLEQRALELAEGELQRIRGMVEELLTLAQMDSWQYSLDVGPADLGGVLRDAASSLESKAERYGIEVRVHDQEGEHRLLCDAPKLYQVFLNLLDNGIKYSEAGGRVDVHVFEDAYHLTVRVRDSGMGIPEEDLEQLFERFYRVDKNRSRATGGSGLGLAISRSIVEMHGGTVAVQSKVGVGSTFTVRLPKAPLPSHHAF
jgi:signal transduction histidine kinase